jgi:hypothetical protein
MISIASLDCNMGPGGEILEEVCEVTVHETSTQAHSLIDRLQNQTAVDDELNNVYRGAVKSSKDSQQLL